MVMNLVFGGSLSVGICYMLSTVTVSKRVVASALLHSSKGRECVYVCMCVCVLMYACKKPEE